jgi:Cu-Zn family superoxide dismutase
MRKFFLICIAATIAGCGRNEPADTAQDTSPPAPPAEPAVTSPAAESAVAELQPTQGNTASGKLQLVATNPGVHITGQVSGLKPNSAHGIHIHETGDCSAPDAKSAGAHFAPKGQPHGAPGPGSHVGDLGNIQSDAEGVAQVDIHAEQATLRTGADTDVIGKAIIVHAQEDDLKTQPSGNSGDRIACGVIQ